MKVLVTGGAGYLGRRVVDYLLSTSHEVVVYDRCLFGGDELAGVEGVRLIKGDIRRLQEHEGLFAGVEAVVHMAGMTDQPSCALSPELAVDVNTESARELAQQAEAAGVRRFIMTSDIAARRADGGDDSTLGRTLIDAEDAVIPMASRRFEPVVLRLGVLYGPSQRMRLDLGPNRMASQALRGEPVCDADGNWSLLHVDDAARAVAAILEAPASVVSGERFEAGEPAQPIRDAAQRIAAELEAPGVAKGGALPAATGPAEGQRLTDAVGWRPEHTFGNALGELEDVLRQLAAEADSPEAAFGALRHHNVAMLEQLRERPVEEGGEPVAPRFIGLYKPSLGPEEENAVVQTLRSGWLTSGAHLAPFERMLADAVEAREAVALVSCTAALHLALVRAGVGPGDEVIIPPVTWASTANTIINMGATPVFADIRPDTLNLDPGAVEQALSPRTKVVMPVHLAGQPCEMERFDELAERCGIRIVEDAAHALGARYRGKAIGSLGAPTCFSFYAIKNITTIEGGAVVCNDADEAAWYRMMASNGMGQIAWDRYGRSSDARPVEVLAPGFKYRLNDVSAAIGVEQLKKFPSMQQRRAELAALYRELLEDVEEIHFPRVIDGVDHAWHLFIVRLRLDMLRKDRDAIRADLRRENIGTGLHFYGLHLHQYFQQHYRATAEAYPNATAASLDMVSLPLFPLMEERQVWQVAEALKKVLVHALR